MWIYSQEIIKYSCIIRYIENFNRLKWGYNNVVEPIYNSIFKPIYNNVAKPFVEPIYNNVIKPAGNWMLDKYNKASDWMYNKAKYWLKR